MSTIPENLQHFKILRDAVHFDIEFDQDEIELINTREFQRLRRIKQLGLAYLVYPSASHTRFEHVLGVCYMAQRIIDTVNRASPGTITAEDRKIVRYLALLHDIGHVPFGHTLEDERPVLDTRHDEESRLKAFLFNTAIGDKMEKVEKNFALKNLRDSLIAILASTGKSVETNPRKIASRQKLYADIVANTICADLLDYLKRDTLFTGIQHRYDDRIISSFRVADDQIFIHLTDDRSTRTGLLSEILHLLRLRYTLGERVYYHRTKAAASAMISRAVELLGLRAEDLYDIGDDELLFTLENPELLVGKFPHLKKLSKDQHQAAKRIVDLLRKRALYQPIFRISRGDADGKHQQAELVGKYSGLKSKAREQIEQEITTACELEPGQVVVYCPDAEMSLKEARVKVRYSPESNLEMLKHITDRNIKDDIAALEEKHRSLWSLEVLLDPDVIPLKGKRAADVFQSFHKDLTNDISSYRATGAGELEYAALIEAVRRTGQDVSMVQVLIETAHKDGLAGLVTPEKWLAAFPDQLKRDLFSQSKHEGEATK